MVDGGYGVLVVGSLYRSRSGRICDLCVDGETVFVNHDTTVFLYSEGFYYFNISS